MPLNTVTLATWMLRTAPDAVRVVSGASSTYGLLNKEDDYQPTDGGGVALVSERTLTVAAGSITLAVESTVTIGATVYRVLSPPMPYENGDLVRYRVDEAGTTA